MHKKSRLSCFVLLAVWPWLAGSAAGEQPGTEHSGMVESLPSGEEWLAHATRDLFPYWSSEEALGDPIGRFPTFRYADGEPIDPGELLREDHAWIPEHADWMASKLDRSYTRMISRQAYVLAMAFHLTGDGRYLAWSKAAVDLILGELQDEEGSFCSWIVRGQCQPAPRQRTAQDLAYALLGPAAYAYVTRDDKVLAALVEAQRRLFASYRDAETGLFRWVLEDLEDGSDRFETAQLELVAQLDQVNAYLLLLAPLVPESEAERWREDLRGLARVLIERFYAPEHGVFWGRIDDEKYRAFGGHFHTDTGHTAKSYWMLYLAGRLLGDEAMQKLAGDGGRRLLENVYLEEKGSWAGGWDASGTPKWQALWWAFAELDQLAATLALDRAAGGPSTARYLGRTYDFWLTYFVDHHHGGTWSSPVDPAEQPPGLKASLWKNGYHAVEHALVGYITGNALRGEPVTVYFAPDAGRELDRLAPYYFTGQAEVVRRLPLRSFEGRERLEVRFSEIR